MFRGLGKSLVFLLVVTSMTMNGAWATYRPVGKATCVRARNYSLESTTRQKIQDQLRASALQCSFAVSRCYPLLLKYKSIWEINGWSVPRETPITTSMRLQP
jgi:hypothetical protein